MRVFILDKEKITKFNLPNKISGVFAIDYLPVGSKIKRTVSIESQDNEWVLKSNGSINALNGNVLEEKMVLKEYQFQQIQIRERNDFVIMYCIPSNEEKNTKLSPQKDQIIIGSGTDVSIGFPNNLVLPQHLAISKQKDGWYVQAKQDPNRFAYLNDKVITTNKLQTGDVIFLYGLKLIWMGNFIQINQPPVQLFINNFSLANYQDISIQDNTKVDPLSEEEKAIDLYNEHDYFFHTPRLKQSLEEEEITIDAPPQNQETEDMPFLLTLGSSITMLSTSCMTGYSAISGLASGEKYVTDVLPQLIMCAALITGSILMPRIIAAYQKKRRKKREKHRQEKYTKYVKSKEEKINMILLNQAQILKNNNLSIQEVYTLVFSKSKTAIWNREIRDDDFLKIKVGTGNSPAKLKINAPEEHFTLDDDNLEN